MTEKYGLGAGTSQFEEIWYTLNIQSNEPQEVIQDMIVRAEASCHATQSLINPVPVKMTLRLNGTEISGSVT